MYLIAAIIALEIVSGLLIALPTNSPYRSHQEYMSQMKQEKKNSANILGEQDSPTGTPTLPDSQPTVEPPTAEPPTAEPPTQPPLEQPTDMSVPPTAEPAITSTPPNQDNTSTPDTSIHESPTPDTFTNDSPIHVDINSPSQPDTGQPIVPTSVDSLANPPAINMQSSTTALDTAAFPDMISASPSETISTKTVQETVAENTQLQQVTAPKEEAMLLVNFSANNIQTIHANITQAKLNDVEYGAQRLNYQLDKTLDTIQTLKPADANIIKAKVDTICKNAEYIFRPSELIVTENVEQSLEITRGKCFNLQQ